MSTNDTHPAAANVQIEILRGMTCARRFQITARLTQTARNLSRRAVARSMPGATPMEILLRWIEVMHGPELAGRVKRFVQARES